jgi:hypothetical protein
MKEMKKIEFFETIDEIKEISIKTLNLDRNFATSRSVIAVIAIIAVIAVICDPHKHTHGIV